MDLLIVRKIKVVFAAIFTTAVMIGCAYAQELEPRAYSPAPIGLNAIIFSYARSSGDVFFEPSFAAKDAKATLNFGAVAYYRTLDVFGRLANITIAVPYADGRLKGSAGGRTGEIYRSGLNDSRVRFAVNLRGTPAMELREFSKFRPKTVIGASIVISAPSGQYDPTKVINIGANRWAFKPEIGVARYFGRWQMDAYGGAWFFTANNNFLGKRQTADPIASFQLHLSYNFRPGFWAGLNTNFYAGGRTTIDNVDGSLVLRNSRIGATCAVPVARNQSVKFTISHGAFVSRGGDFTSIGASYNYAWSAKH